MLSNDKSFVEGKKVTIVRGGSEVMNVFLLFYIFTTTSHGGYLVLCHVSKKVVKVAILLLAAEDNACTNAF